MPQLQVSQAIHDAAIHHLRNLTDFAANLGPEVHCVAGSGGGYGPDNPVSLFWAWGSGFDEGFNLSLSIEDGQGNMLPPVVDVQNVPTLPGGLFTTTFQWQRHPVARYDNLPTPVLHVKSTDGVEGWTRLRVEDVYIAGS